MKAGYEMLPSAGDDSAENRPLVANGSSSLDETTKNRLNKFVMGVTGGILGLLLLWYKEHQNAISTQGPTQVIVTPPEQVSEAKVRPFCQYYGGKNKQPRIIQTSMKFPDQQWATIPCFENTNKQPKSVVLNAYAAPDAILQVDFAQIAHPERKVPILGFGGAFTEASGRNFHTLSEAGKEAVMELLFGKSGLGYAIGRFHINSCDFSVESYSFDETADDFELVDFDMGVKHDVETGMVDMALRAEATLRKGWGKPSGDSADGNLFLFASPWSPPAWMKTPTLDWKDNLTISRMTGSAQPNCLKEGVGPESRYAKSWALYFSKFVSAYKKLGLSLDAITVQNEPEFPAPWEACSYTPETQQDFVSNHLGPQLAKDHPDVKIFAFDHNKDHVVHWSDILLNETSPAKPFISGTAYHWYAGGMDRLLDGAVGIPNLHRLQERLNSYGVKSDHIVLNSEACHCPTTGYAGGDIQNYWSRAERYAHTILADLAAGSNGWVEWNLILDSIGGPNHLGNLCETSILAVPHRALDAENNMNPLPRFEKQEPFGKVNIGDGRTREELNALGFPAKYLDVGVAVQPIYYYMGHISRYVRPGSVAVMGLVSESLGMNGHIFRTPESVVAGGGQNDLARIGIEVTAWPCEGSTRQQFDWFSSMRNRILVYGHDWLGKPTKACIGKLEDKDFLGLTLVDCESEDAGDFVVLPVIDDDKKRKMVKLMNNPSQEDACLVIRELRNGGGAYGPRGGAQVTLGSCDHESAKWFMNKETGAASSLYFADSAGNRNEVCMTTGWPFLQMGAFITPNGETSKTVVILNEANDAANYALKDSNNVVMTASIPPRSIQTVLLD